MLLKEKLEVITFECQAWKRNEKSEAICDYTLEQKDRQKDNLILKPRPKNI